MDAQAPETLEAEIPAARRGWGEWSITAVLAIIGVVVLWDGLSQPPSTSASGIGAGAAPIVVGSLILALTVILAIQVARGRRGEAEVAEGDVDITITKWIPFAVTIAALLFFVFTVDLIGYIPASTGMFVLVAWAMGGRRILMSLLIGFLVSTGIFFVFTRLLEIYLPAGPLEGII